MRQFSVGGSLALKTAFLEECKNEFQLPLKGSSDISGNNNILSYETGYRAAPYNENPHFTLPKDWVAAKEAFRTSTGNNPDAVIVAGKWVLKVSEDGDLDMDGQVVIRRIQLQPLFDVLDTFNGKVVRHTESSSGWELHLDEFSFSIGCTAFTSSELQRVKMMFERAATK